MTVNATCPALMCFKPSLREINLQCGGKIDETRTMLQAAMPAFRNASSKLDSRSRCLPTPFVRKIFFATNAMWIPSCGASKNAKIKAHRKLTSVRGDVNRIQCCRAADESSTDGNEILVHGSVTIPSRFRAMEFRPRVRGLIFRIRISQSRKTSAREKKKRPGTPGFLRPFAKFQNCAATPALAY